jgi:hypothetical protein
VEWGVVWCDGVECVFMLLYMALIELLIKVIIKKKKKKVSSRGIVGNVFSV